MWVSPWKPFDVLTGGPIDSVVTATLLLASLQALGNWGEERLVSTVCACAAPQVFVGTLETTVMLVCVAQPYITETRESFTPTRRISVVRLP